MIEIIRDGCLQLPKQNNDKLIENIKSNLTRTIKNHVNSTIRIVEFFIENDDFLYIPRYYPIEDIIKCKIVNKENDGLNININTNIKLKDQLQENTFNFMMSNNNGIINLDTGSGKTIISIYFISHLKKKTLILLHRKNLIEQWIEKIERFTDIKLNENMTILKNSKIEESFNNSIILATVQSIKSGLEKHKNKMINQLQNSGIGLLIADEIHSIIGPEKFSDASLFISSPRVFGLSATPYRKDGTTDILKYHLGEIFKPEDKSEIIMKSKVKVFFLDYGILNKSRRYVYWSGRFQRSRYLNLLKNSEILNNLCLNLLNRLIESNRNVFLIAERIKFIKQLFDNFNYENKNTFIEKDSNDNLIKQFIFATPGKLRDGIDEPNKDTLVLTSPIGNIQQASGRILRFYKDKQIPLVIDLVDVGCSDISKTFYSRLKFYKSRNWEIEFIHIDKDNKTILIDGSKIKELIK